MGKQRREQPPDSIFGNNPFGDGFLEWMGSREGQQCMEIHDVLWDLLEDVQLDAKQRQLICLTQNVPRENNGSISINPSNASKNCTQTFPATRSRSSYLTGSWATIPKTTPGRNSTNSTSLQRSGLPTISGRPRSQKNGRELVTLEYHDETFSRKFEHQSRCLAYHITSRLPRRH